MKGKVIKQMKNGPYPAPESTGLVHINQSKTKTIVRTSNPHGMCYRLSRKKWYNRKGWLGSPIRSPLSRVVMLKKQKGELGLCAYEASWYCKEPSSFLRLQSQKKKSGLIYFFQFLPSEVLLSPGSKKVKVDLEIFVSFLDFVGFLDLVALLDIVDLLYIPRSHFGPLGSFVPFGSFRTHGSFGLVRLYWHGGLFGPFGLH